MVGTMNAVTMGTAMGTAMRYNDAV